MVTAANARDVASWLGDVAFDERGLVTVIAQDVASGRVLMVAWADAQALAETVATGQAVYFSRSRGHFSPASGWVEMRVS